MRRSFRCLLLLTALMARTGLGMEPPSCTTNGLARLLIGARFRWDLPLLKPMAPASIEKVEFLKLGSVYRIDGPEGTQVVRLFSATKTDLRREAFASAFFRTLPATWASNVRFVQGEDASALLHRLRELRPGDASFKDASQITVASFEEGTVGSKVMRRFPKVTSAGQFFRREVGAKELSPELLQQAADLWATCRLLSIHDCHEGNWLLQGKRVVGVDLAYPAGWAFEPGASIADEDVYSPFRHTRVVDRDIREILAWTSSTFRLSLLALTKEDIKAIAVSAGYVIKEGEIKAILRRRGRLLEEITKAGAPVRTP